MENFLGKLWDQAPGLAVAVFLVIVFMKYMDKKDLLFQTLFERMEVLHNKTLDKIDNNTMALGVNSVTIQKCQTQTERKV